MEFFNQAIDESTQSFVSLITTNEVDSFINRKAQTLIAMQKYDEAIKNLDVVLMRKPMNAVSHFLKAKAFVAKGESLKAQQEINAADKIWKNADKDFIDYLEFKKFTAQIQ